MQSGEKYVTRWTYMFPAQVGQGDTWYIYIMEYFSATKNNKFHSNKDKQNTVLSETGQRKTNTI